MELVTLQSTECVEVGVVLDDLVTYYTQMDSVYGLNWYNYFACNADPVPVFLNNCVMSLGYVKVEDLVRDSDFDPNKGPSTITAEKTSPVMLPYDWKADMANYGSYLTGFRVFSESLGFRSMSTHSHRNENQTRHDTWSGRYRCFPLVDLIGSRDSSRALSSTYFSGPSLPYRADQALGMPLHAVTKVQAMRPARYELLYDPSSRTRPNRLEDALADIAAVASDSCYGGDSWSDYETVSRCYIKNFRYLSTVGLISVDYDFSYQLNYTYWLSRGWPMENPCFWWQFHVHLEFGSVPYGDVQARSALDVGQTRDIEHPFRVKLATTIECTDVLDGAWGTWPYRERYLMTAPYWMSAPSKGYRVTASSYYHPIRFLSGISSVDTQPTERTLVTIATHSPLKAFAAGVDASWDDIRPSSFCSQSDALEDSISFVDTNLIEALSDVDSFFDVLPDIKELVNIAKGISGGLSFKSLYDLVKWLSSEDLRYVFGTRQNFDLIVNVLPRLLATIEKMRSLTHKPIVGRGSLVYEFPQGTFGRPSSVLIARSKAVLNSYPSGVVADLLGLDALGMLPSASNFWDLIPLSFVVDWLLNVGDRLKDVESMALLAMLDLNYFVHSYKIVTPVLEQDYASLNLAQVDAGFLSVYLREVSHEVAPPRSSRFDFRLPSKMPNWLTAGSLLIQKS